MTGVKMDPAPYRSEATSQLQANQWFEMDEIKRRPTHEMGRAVESPTTGRWTFRTDFSGKRP